MRSDQTPYPEFPEFPDLPGNDRTTGLSTGTEASTGPAAVLVRIYQSLAEFTILTGLLRKTVDARLAARLEVTGWSGGVLRVRLSQPALATRWRFQEPAVLRQLARLPEFRGLREIRLVFGTAGEATEKARPRRPLRLPVAALQALAADESNARLRQALEALAAAAEQPRKDG